jgi:circadian clock protein KaiC
MAQNPLRYRRQILALKTFLASHRATVLMLDDQMESNDHQLESIAHGVVDLDYVRPDFGAERRRVSIAKLRGVSFVGGYHDYQIRTGGIEVFPRLIAAEHAGEPAGGFEPSGIAALDQLLHGGLDRGTSTLLMGPAGSGKSTVALQYAVNTAVEGGRSAIFAFDESLPTLRMRAAGLRMPLEEHMRTGRVSVRRVDPAQMSPGQFVALVRQLVEGDGVRTLVIDSLNGLIHAMPNERFLVVQLHELLSYLGQNGVTTIMTLAEHGVVGHLMAPVDLSYLADTVMVLRYFEHDGSVRKSIAVVKKRAGAHEDTVRELKLKTDHGIVIGAPLREFRNVLGGVPTFTGSATQMLGMDDAAGIP